MGNRIMVFIDGLNLQTQMAKYLGIKYPANKPPPSTIEVAHALVNRHLSSHIGFGRDYPVVRMYWFASYQGNDDRLRNYKEVLRQNWFEPKLYKHKKDTRDKAVHMGIATEMLTNAFQKNFDIGLLIAGDGDYLELINEMKRFGIEIHGGFFKRGMDTELRLSLDKFNELESQAGFNDLISNYAKTIRSEIDNGIILQ